MIKLFTDSASNLPEELTDKYGITAIPFIFHKDGVEMSGNDEGFDGKEYYDSLRNGSSVKTSMINPATFEEYFESALTSGDDVMYVGMSGGISGTAHAAVNAARTLRSKYPSRRIETVDTLGASLGEGMLVLEAAKMIDNGASIDAVKKSLLSRRREMHQYFTVEDLMYLRKSGRISSVSAVIGGALGIRPILKGDKYGKIVMCGKERGRRRAFASLADSYDQLSVSKDGLIGIAHSDNEEGAEELLGKLKEKGFAGECINVCYEPMTGSHVGPGAVALFFFGKRYPDED